MMRPSDTYPIKGQSGCEGEEKQEGAMGSEKREA